MSAWAFRAATLAAALLSGACTSAPPAPDWQDNAFSSINSFTSAYLEGNSRVADYQFERAQRAVARTGRPDLMARLALVRCAAQLASLEPGICQAFATLALDAEPAERNYALFLAGQWDQLQPDQLPEPYREWAQLERAKIGRPAPSGAGTPGNSSHISTLELISAPQSRLIAAAIRHQSGLITPADVGLAVETASRQGWRRPLLAWLGVQHALAKASGDVGTAARVQRRIDLLGQIPAP